jgi:REP element-mobilizing transposase RayT
MARRHPEIDPLGYYHVSSRGAYGRPLFETPNQHELFLELYRRVAKRYGWRTLTWTLMKNHHHFVIRLTNDGLSEGMRTLHSGYSRRIHAIEGQTGMGHLVRHCFYGGQLKTEDTVMSACRYIDLNATRAGLCSLPEDWRWSGHRALVGLEAPRAFHHPGELLGLITRSPSEARARYRSFVLAGLDQIGLDPTSEQGVGTATSARVVESARDRHRYQPGDRGDHCDP